MVFQGESSWCRKHYYAFLIWVVFPVWFEDRMLYVNVLLLADNFWLLSHFPWGWYNAEAFITFSFLFLRVALCSWRESVFPAVVLSQMPFLSKSWGVVAMMVQEEFERQGFLLFNSELIFLSHLCCSTENVFVSKEARIFLGVCFIGPSV